MSQAPIEFVKLGVFAAGAAATLPLSCELALLTAANLLPRRTRRSSSQPVRLGVLIPAHNEEELIARTVTSVRNAASGGSVDLLVIADNCTDRTAQAARAAGAEVIERTHATLRGKGHALAVGYRSLFGRGCDGVLVIDADSVVSSNLLTEVMGALGRGADAVQCRYEVRNATASLRTRWMRIAFLAFNVVRPRGRGRLGLSAGILGNGFALSRTAYESVPPNAFSVVEDLEHHLNLVRSGKRVEFLEAATVWGEVPAGGAGVGTQRARWEGGRMLMARQWTPRLLMEVLRGRLRLLEPLADLAGLPLAQHLALVVLLAALPLPAARVYAATALAVVLVHVLTAAALSGEFWRNVGVLVLAPFYVVWKIGMIPAILLASKANTPWIRTQREHETR